VKDCAITDTVRENLVNKRNKIKQWNDKQSTKCDLRPGDEELVLFPSDSSKMVA